MYPEDDLNVQGIKPGKLNLPMSAIPSSGFLCSPDEALHPLRVGYHSNHIEAIYITSLSAMGKGGATVQPING